MNRIIKLEEEVQDLKKKLQDKENELNKLKRTLKKAGKKQPNSISNGIVIHFGGLPKSAISRYSRQILLEEIGARGQARLCAARVLVVGAGGLGCPAALYLAGAGIGEIGIVDYDTVEVSNIHRQVLHTELDEGRSKAHSAADSLKRLNSSITVKPYHLQLNSKNAKEIISNYDVVLDCTDNLPTRYLLNDACVMMKVPLISGSALKMEGQLTIYGYRTDISSEEKSPWSLSPRGPCYRCVFPAPPPAPPAALAPAGSCGDVGVAGPVTATIGSLQALEAIKYLVETPPDKLLVERMLIFDGEDATFRTVKLRPRNLSCVVCSAAPALTELVDYEQLCGTPANDTDLRLHILPVENRIKAKELMLKLTSNQNGGGDSNQRHLLVDVRCEAEFEMCRIDGAVNYPIDKLTDRQIEHLKHRIENEGLEVTLLCRRGNDSQIVTKKLLDSVADSHRGKVKDVVGGLHSWARDVDDNFPIY